MIRMMCIAGAVSLFATLAVGAQGGTQAGTPADSTPAKIQYPAAPPPLRACRAGAYPEVDAGPGPIYVVGDLLVGGDSTVPGYVAKMPVYVNGGDVAHLDVIKGPDAVALYGCRARQGAIRIELKPEVKLRPEWRALSKTLPAPPRAPMPTPPTSTAPPPMQPTL